VSLNEIRVNALGLLSEAMGRLATEGAQAMIKTKRAYDTVDGEDGIRFLVDRLWPKGIGKDKSKVDTWLKDVAPITELRRWFGHDPTKWSEFRRRYFSELRANPNGWRPIVEAVREGAVTLLYGVNGQTHDNAVALREFLRAHLARAK
jgi:uncharacterized protein YeaO (DUF488 family)